MPKSKNKQTAELFAEEVVGRNSEAKNLGRRLMLKFEGVDKPELCRLEFQARSTSILEFLQLHSADNAPKSFRVTPVPKAFGIFFLDYLCAMAETPPKSYHMEGKKGDLVSPLGNALSKTNGKWYRLFNEKLKAGGTTRLVPHIFGGFNIDGRPPGYRIIKVKSDYLPPDCIEIFWGDRHMDTPEKIRSLTYRFRKAWNLPPPAEIPVPDEPVLPRPEPPIEKEPVQGRAKPGKASPQPEPKAGKTIPQSQPFVPGSASKPQETDQEESKPRQDEPRKSEAKDFQFPGFEAEIKTPNSSRSSTISFERPKPEIRPIPPEFFKITNPEQLVWEDSDPLINFGDDANELDMWKIRDASEGALILGGVGSGKTSGSGAALGETLLTAGYGGLVMTVKQDEAKRWIRLCERTGRLEDCIHVTATSGHQLNILQYEAERPGDRISVTDDMISLFRNLLDAMRRNKSASGEQEFWTNSVDDLMKALINLFLLAKEPITIASLMDFLGIVPVRFPSAWESVPRVLEMIMRAHDNARDGTDADKSCFHDMFAYWTNHYPSTTEVTRSGIVTNFNSLASIMTGRGIQEMISSGTNLTPEMILSGKIVILDLPVKAGLRGNLMVQAAYKLLFQQAIERRADKGKKTARPVFLWEDEGHEFFSDNDVRFQPTARDCRACHIIMSQNLHNFFHLGHHQDAVLAVFAAINTCIFHSNGDHETNRWASDKIGQLKKLHLSSSGLVKPFDSGSYSLFERNPDEVKHIGGLSINEKMEDALRPEDFGKLKRGGDGTCEAVIYWLSHKFAVNKGRNFCVRVFSQEDRHNQ